MYGVAGREARYGETGERLRRSFENNGSPSAAQKSAITGLRAS